MPWKTEMSALESAIPVYLGQERTRPMAMKDGCRPATGLLGFPQHSQFG